MVYQLENYVMYKLCELQFPTFCMFVHELFWIILLYKLAQFNRFCHVVPKIRLYSIYRKCEKHKWILLGPAIHFGLCLNCS